MHAIVELAKQTIEEYIKSGKTIAVPRELPPELSGKAGVFVSLKKMGNLRGCIGTFEPTTETVAQEVVRNAIAAATQDPRFHAVEEDELPELEYSVDVLSPPERIQGKEDLDPRKYGIIIVQGMRRGLLLPDLEGVDTVEEQLRITKMKAGIWTDEDLDIFRFTVTRYR
ncbi:MAG: AmmeMemoRadiSam system protein A [Nitrospirae bacterium]|nr:AmmeMemoRadiSam system protein A [Nitrospirota bacterium]